MELHFSNTRSVTELKVAKGILFLDTAKVYHGDVDDLELKISFLKEHGLRSRKVKLGQFFRLKENSVQVIDFKKHINTRSWITITETHIGKILYYGLFSTSDYDKLLFNRFLITCVIFHMYYDGINDRG